MKTIKRIAKKVVLGYLNGFQECARMQYGYLYEK